MLFAKALLFAITASAAVADSTSLRTQSRELTVCGEVTKCYFKDLGTGEEYELKDGFEYKPSDNPDYEGYSVRCVGSESVIGSDTPTINRIKFKYDGDEHIESTAPYWADGDQVDEDGQVVPNRVEYFGVCGKKHLVVEGWTWDEALPVCTVLEFSFEAKCDEPECPADKKLDGSGFCVEKWCCTDFQCPPHSARKPDRQCYNNVHDCYCLPGYHMNCYGKCVENDVCNYTCPANSHKKPNRRCYNNFDDCECNRGYKKVGGYCVKSWCCYDYKCPFGMKRKEGRECYNNRDDCTWW